MAPLSAELREAAAAGRQAVEPRGYIITAALRPQWEHRRGNCAL